MEIYKSGRDQPLLDWQWLEPSLRNITHLVLKHVPGRGGRALDVGCGTGRVAFPLADRGYHVDGIDIEPRVIDLAQKIRQSRSAYRCSFRLGDYRDPKEVVPAHYDLVVCSEVLEHVEDYKPIVTNMYRSLKRGGRLIVTVPCDMRKFTALDRYAGHVRRFEREQLREDLAPFRTTKVIVTGFPFYRLVVLTYILAMKLGKREHSNEALWSKRSTRIVARLVYPFTRFDNCLAFTGWGDALVAIADK